MEKKIGLPSFELYYLNPSIINEDYTALKNAALHIQTITGDTWPDDSFTYEDDLEELKAHEQEFLAGESFGYAARKNGIQIGSLYFYRSEKKNFDFVCTLWTDRDDNDYLLYEEAKEYMTSFAYRIAYVPFEISKEDYLICE